MPPSLQAAPTPLWFKSSYSGGNATECVECAYLSHAALIRDSKHTEGPTLRVRSQTWRRFVDSVREGSRQALWPECDSTHCSTSAEGPPRGDQHSFTVTPADRR
ncbi:DUF397 domain-containing protein [Streptomyces sp. NPDC058737]|uniref:DUF397 domain-containing protein n=1 Tax=Streptomyces sp. NPDC058737 TaxID=3346617 RepID=UPI0036CEBA87